MDKLQQLIDDLVHLLRKKKGLSSFLWKDTNLKLISPTKTLYPETFLLVRFNLDVQVFQCVGEATVSQIFPHMFICPLYCERHVDFKP